MTTFLILLIAVPAFASADSFYDQQWGLKRVRAAAAWAAGQGSGITIAIVDTGVDGSHPDLSTNVVPGYDFVGNDSNPNDETSGPGEDCPGNPGHGTHVAGIAAAVANNNFGIAGVAPMARIMPVRVLNQYGCGSIEQVAAGVAWAVSNGAHVVNLSLGEEAIDRNLFGPALEDAVNDAWSKGVIPIVAGGNDRLFPSGYSNVNAIVVGATDQNDEKASYSNLSESKWAMTAPGSSIISTIPGNRFGSLSGTSMATPHVAGAAGVLRCLGLTPDQTRQRLLSQSDDLGLAGTDPVFGHGRLNVEKAASGLAGCAAAVPTQRGSPSNPTSPARVGSGGIGSSPRTGLSPVPSNPVEGPNPPEPRQQRTNQENQSVASTATDEGGGLNWFLVAPALGLLGVGSFFLTKTLLRRLVR